MKYKFLIFLLLVIANIAHAQKYSFDKGWRFHLGDIAFPKIVGHGQSYDNAKAGKAWGAAAPEYNDAAWRKLNVPHDWAVEGGFDSTANISQGYRNRGYGWYRKKFRLDVEDEGKHLELQFEGIATFATIWFNGSVVHRNWCGYTSFYIDITSMAKYGDELNTIAIRVDANAMEGWWYEGAGMYRRTWLVKREPVHIKTDGVYAHPVKKDNGWIVPVEVTVNNSSDKKESIEVTSTLVDATGKTIATGHANGAVGALKDEVVKYNLAVSNPKLWTLEQPALYKVITTVKRAGIKADELTTTCGFRTIRFDKNTGFYLNDKHIKIQGVCNHQDHAGVGVAIPDALWEYRLIKMKEMGVNAYRCSHNPPPARLLQLCDSLGIMVMDENRNFNVSPEYANQLEWLVRRDRNHPSIILWSVFNEEPMQGTVQGYEMVRRMSAIVKSLDTTRPVTAAMNGGLFTKKNVSDAVDVVGFNYQIWAYDRYRKENPDKILTSSEDVSSFQIRGEYKTDRKQNIIDDYDSEGAPWGSTQRVGWKAIAERPWLAGSFIWTGFDYRGEPTPLSWPTAGSVFGLMDLCGFPKNAYYIKQAQWKKNEDILHVAPHWNWPQDSVGKNIKVMVYSNADSISLKLNGKNIGGQKVDIYEMNTWMVPYAPGTLEATSYKNGKKINSYKTETTGKPVSISLEPYKKSLLNDGMDAMPVTIKVLDAKGRAVPTANMMVHFSINNKAAIIGVGNGNPNSHEPEKVNYRRLYNGLAQAIIQSTEGEKGMIELTATADGLKPASVRIPLEAVATPLFIDAALAPMMLTNFKMSPASNNKPDAKIKLADNDMNSWQAVKPGELVDFSGGKYVLFSTNFTLDDVKHNSKGKLLIRRIKGDAEVWLNDQLIHTKSSAQQEDIAIPIITDKEKNKLVIIVHSEDGTKAGLGGNIIIMP